MVGTNADAQRTHPIRGWWREVRRDDQLDRHPPIRHRVRTNY